MKTVIVPAPGKIEIRQVETPVINACAGWPKYGHSTGKAGFA